MSKDQEAAGAGSQALSRRRTYTTEQRRQIVAETWAPGASVSIVARRHDVNANLVFKWRQRYGERAGGKPVLLPVQITEPAGPVRPDGAPRSRAASAKAGWIEIDLAGGHYVRIHGAVGASLVRHVLRNLAR